MSLAPAAPGAPVRFAFSAAADGDLRESESNRARFAEKVGAPVFWAELRQVHGSEVIEVSGPESGQAADALFTRTPGVPLGVFVADCVGVVIEANGGVGVAHAGWRGAAAGVVSRLVTRMRGAGLEPVSAHLSPFIGPCCFEVGREVADQFPTARARTRGGKPSVDLGRVIAAQLPVPVDTDTGCTYHDETYLSHRRLGRKIGAERVGRMVALAWVDPR